MRSLTSSGIRETRDSGVVEGIESCSEQVSKETETEIEVNSFNVPNAEESRDNTRSLSDVGDSTSGGSNDVRTRLSALGALVHSQFSDDATPAGNARSCLQST